MRLALRSSVKPELRSALFGVVEAALPRRKLRLGDRGLARRQDADVLRRLGLGPGLGSVMVAAAEAAARRDRAGLRVGDVWDVLGLGLRFGHCLGPGFVLGFGLGDRLGLGGGLEL